MVHMIDAILNTLNINIIMRIVYNMKCYYNFGKKDKTRGDERTWLIKSSGEWSVVTGSRITVIDASEHALGFNTPSRDKAPTKDHLYYCHQVHCTGFFRRLLQLCVGVSAVPCTTPLWNERSQVNSKRYIYIYVYIYIYMVYNIEN